MSQNQVDILKRALEQEIAARQQVEKILQEKSNELFYSNQKLEKLNQDLETLLTTKDSQLQGVFENIVDAYLIIDLKGNVLKMNHAALSLLGFENDKLDFNLLQLIHPSDHEKGVIAYHKLLKENSITDYEINIITKTNLNKIVHINASVIHDKNKPVALQGILRDITSVKENEFVNKLINDITHSILGKLNLYDIAEVITDKIANYLRTDDCVIYLYHEENDTLEQIAAYGEKLDVNNKMVNKLIFKVGQGIVGSVAKTGKAEIVYNTSMDERYIVDIVQRKSEITVPIKIGNKVIGIIDSENELENFYTQRHLEVLSDIAKIIGEKLKTAIDLRERERIEEKLIQSESRLASLILNLDTGILLEDENRKIVLTNYQFCNFFQIPASPESLIGMDCSNSAEQSKDLFKDPESFVNDIKEILHKREIILGEELSMVNGKIFERDYIPIFGNNKYKGHLWTYKDVTLRRKYRNSLEAQSKKYKDIIANMNLGLMEVDNDDIILLVNQSFLDMSGYNEEELIGKKASNIFALGKELEKIKKENKKREKGISSSYEIKIKNKSGEVRHWLISGAPNYNFNGEHIGSIGIHLDISDLKNLQLQKEKLLTELGNRNEQLEEYAHIVSHDLKSPLNNIYALVAWVKEDNQGKFDTVSLENFRLIENSLEKMEQLITNVLQYSKAGVKNEIEENVDTQELVNDILDLIFIPDHISIKVLNPLPTVRGDKIKIHQVFQNFISNAIKYNDKENGMILIDVEVLENHYKFIIKDNGIGIEKQYHEKIFKLYQSLNKTKDSTGLGLSIAKKIVNLHKGKIWLESEPNLGTTFYFTLKK